MTLRELFSRLRHGRLDRDLEDEIAAHLELAKAENLKRGMDPDDARRLAAVKFGSITSAKEGVWDQRGLPELGSFLQDAKYAARGMRKSPGFTFVTVLTLALCIGLCSVVFSVLNGTFLRPVPGVPDPDRLVSLQSLVTYPTFEKYRDQNRPAAAFIGPVPFGVALDSHAPPLRIFGHLVSLEYFSVLGVQPLLGRFFDAASDLPGAAPTVVVSERFWRVNLHSDPNIIGSTLRLNGRPATIVGVGPKDFIGVLPAPHPAEIFVPVTVDPRVAASLDDDVLHRNTDPEFRVLLRLPPRTSMSGAEARLDAETRQFADPADREEKTRLVRLISAAHLAPVPAQLNTMVVMFYTILVVLILSLTCANLAGLILARGRARAREIAVRLSIGASRFRLIRQLLTESLLLAVLGGASGFSAIWVFFKILPRLSPGTEPMIQNQYDPDFHLALLAFLISTVAGVGFGLMPALAITRPDLATALKASLRTGFGNHRRFGLRNLFVVYQVSAAMILVLLMGFVTIGLSYGTNRAPGFDPASLYVFSLDPGADGFTSQESAAMFAGLTQRSLNGIDRITFSDQAVFSFGDSFPNTAVIVRDAVKQVAMQMIGPGFFATLGVPILRGAEFTDRDLHSDPALLPAIINMTAARELFGNADPLGRRIRQDDNDFQVIGVVHFDRPVIFKNQPVATIFLPMTMQDLGRRPRQGTTVIVRAGTHLDEATLRKSLAAVDVRLNPFELRTMQADLAEQERLGQIVAAFYLPIGMFGLILACLGLAGVTAQAVELRRKEIGIRMALGARREQLLGLVMHEGVVMVTTGAAFGLVCAYGFARAIAAAFAPIAQVIAWGGSNPMLTLGVPALLVSLALIACYVPARRSASIDPLIALRED